MSAPSLQIQIMKLSVAASLIPSPSRARNPEQDSISQRYGAARHQLCLFVGIQIGVARWLAHLWDEVLGQRLCRMNLQGYTAKLSTRLIGGLSGKRVRRLSSFSSVSSIESPSSKVSCVGSFSIVCSSGGQALRVAMRCAFLSGAGFQAVAPVHTGL